MTEVIPKNFPSMKRSDKIFPVYIWQRIPEVLILAKYDYVKNRKLTLSQAKDLNTQIMYENTKFRWEKGKDFAINKLYSGVAVFDSKNNLKSIKTSKHILHYL
jgi:hypothetical protein